MRTLNFNLKKVFITAIAGILYLPLSVQAVCTVTGKIISVRTYDDSFSSTGCHIYMRNSALASHYYYVASNDDDMCSNANNSQISEVRVSGNATACPTSGQSRSMGRLRSIIHNP